MEISRETLVAEVSAFLDRPGENEVGVSEALSADVAGLKLFDAPLLGLSAAGDPLYHGLKRPEAVGPWFLEPGEWLPGAETVISLFFPFSEAVRRSNVPHPSEPSHGWLHARIEGQAVMLRLCRHLTGFLEAAGRKALCPALDPRFASVERPGSNPAFPADAGFTSRWSERHAAYISGLGTFGLSKGLITERGVCGRFASLITDAVLAPTPRPYSTLYEYCTRCGACVRRCPADAIRLEGGKEHVPCSYFVDQTKEAYAPRYGCGKCQTAVPCEHRIPRKPRA